MALTVDSIRRNPIHRLRRVVGVALTLGLLGPAAPGVGKDSDYRVPLVNGSVAVLTAQHEIRLESVPRRGEGLQAFTERFCGTSRLTRQVSQANGGKRSLLVGVRYKVPFELLAAEWQLRVIKGLFPDDRVDPGGWRHRVRAPSGAGAESLWFVSEIFTGRGENYKAIREANDLVDHGLAPGQVVLIPARYLRSVFRTALPPESQYHLTFKSDGEGDYAVYRLKAGEALYSSVIIRFTGRVFADDVNALAAEVAKRSGISDVTDIPIGYAVNIPFDLLMPEHLPAGHPRRQEYEEEFYASSQYSNQVRAERLRGVTLVLDAGHGGRDVGASISGVWESLYVYDIMARAKRILETTTGAQVIATTQDSNGYHVPQRGKLPFSDTHRVLTTPNYKIVDSRVGVNLRWYLANSIFRQAVAKGHDPGKVVFVSIHADSLHSSLRGAMVYIPGARYRSGKPYGKSGSVYASRREVRERPTVSYSKAARTESEGLSRDLAHNILDSFRDLGLMIHSDKPIREKVIRKGRAWVPAVIRYNAIPAKVLLEVCNLANSADRQLIQTQEYRQRVAEAVVQGIVSYYDPSGSGVVVRAAASGG